jgi:DNA-binding response OmpR family regulator
MKLPHSILVLDDEPNFCRILEAKLTKASYEVFTAADAAAAFRFLLARRFDLVLLDMRLPDANGLDLLPRLHAVAPATPILLMTAYEVEGLREAALRAGASDVLYKPFDLNVLTLTVQHAIDAGAPPERAAALVSDTLAVGRAVVIQVLSGADSAAHSARVLDEQAESFDVSTEVPLPAALGEPVLVSITGTDAIYEFRSKVLEQQNPATLSLVKPAVIRRNQRRKHTRHSMQRPVEIRVEGADGDAEGRPDFSNLSGMSIDLSAGGMCVALPSSLRPGARISVSIAPSEDQPRTFQADAVVVRSAPVDETAPQPIYRAGLQFANIPPPHRALLRAMVTASGESPHI